MVKKNINISEHSLSILKKISNKNNMSENEVIDKLIFLWNEAGDYYYDDGLTFSFNLQKKVSSEDENCFFYAEMIEDEDILPE